MTLKPSNEHGTELELTLLFGLRQNTISECTFRVRSRPSRLSFIALNAAARICTFDTIYSGLLAISFFIHHHHVIYSWTGTKGGKDKEGETHDASVDEGIFEVGVSGEQLGVQKGSVGDGVEESDVDGVAGGQVVYRDSCEGHYGGESEVVSRWHGEGERSICVGCLGLSWW